MAMGLDNVLQLTFGLLALLTTAVGTYITLKLTKGMSSSCRIIGTRRTRLIFKLGRRQRRHESQRIEHLLPSFRGSYMPATSHQWLNRRSFFMEDIILSEYRGDEMHAS